MADRSIIAKKALQACFFSGRLAAESFEKSPFFPNLYRQGALRAQLPGNSSAAFLTVRELANAKNIEQFIFVRQPIPVNACNVIQKRLLGRSGNKHKTSVGGLPSGTSCEPENALSRVL